MANKLAASVRAKYPGVYDDLDDATLAAKVKQKYPGVYDDLDVEDGPADGGFVPPMPGLPDPRRQTAPTVPAFSPDQTKASLGEQFVDAAYQTRPTKPFEPEHLPSTLGTIAGAGLAATAPVSVPATLMAIGAGAGVTGAAAYTRNQLQNLLPGGASVENPGLDALKEGATEAALGVATLGGARLLSGAGRMMYRGALGAGREAPKVVDDLVETGIRERLNVTRGGRDKALARIDSLNNAVRAQIEGITTESISPRIGLENIKRLRASAEASGAMAPELSAIDDVLETYGKRYAGLQSPVAGHDVKIALQGRNAKAYSGEAQALAGKAAQMEFASGIRESIEDAGKRAAATGRGGAPNIGATNARIGKLHEFEEALKGADARVRPGDVSSMAYLPPQYTVARMGLKSGPQSYLGRQMARVGDALDPSRIGKSLGVDEEGLRQAPMRAEPKAMDEQEAAHALAGIDNVDDSWTKLATDGSGRQTKAAPQLTDDSGMAALYEANTNELDRLGIPMERQSPELTSFERNYPPERLPEDGSVVDVAGVPARRPTAEDVAWERVMERQRADADTAARGAKAQAADAQRTEAYGIEKEWDRHNAEPVQMMLGQPGAEFQMPLREAQQALPMRSTQPPARPGPTPPDRFMSDAGGSERLTPPKAGKVSGGSPMKAQPPSVSQTPAVPKPAPIAATPKAVNGAPAPEAQVFVVKAGQRPRALAPGEASNYALQPGERLAKRASGGAELTLTTQADVVGLNDGSNAGASQFYTNPEQFPGRAAFLQEQTQAAPGRYSIEMETEVPSFELLDDSGIGVNASGESAASAEAISRLRGMQSRGEQFAVMTRDGRFRPLIGADAVDYVPRNGETFGVLTQGPDGRPRFERR